MIYYWTFLCFLFGTCVGSFLNVIILRQSIGGKRRKRSICFNCGHQIENRDLIPIFSFISLKGRCRHCRSRLAFQYPLVEFFTGISFAFLFYYLISKFSFGYALTEWSFLAVIISILIIIFVYDFRHKIIPDWTIIALAALALLRLVVLHFLSGSLGQLAFWTDVSAGILAPLPFFILWLVSFGRWMGLGDAKLMVGLGLFLGGVLWLPAVLISFWIAALLLIILMIGAKIAPASGLFGRFSGMGRKSEVPFGPFLIVGAVLVSLSPNLFDMILGVFFPFLM